VNTVISAPIANRPSALSAAPTQDGGRAGQEEVRNHERQLLTLLVRDLLELARLDLELMPGQLAGVLHRYPLAHRHRSGAGQQTRQPRDQHGLPRDLGAGDAHHEAEV
jgi:hypothetical protein